jgi:hypothetical protein
MIQTIAGRNYYVACISTGRPTAHQRWDEMGLPMITWFVPINEWGDYRGVPRKRPGSARSNAIARNQALKAAFQINVPCILLDDDPISAAEVIDQKAHPITYPELLTKLAQLHVEYGTHLTAASRNTNPFYVRRDLNFHPKLTTGVCIIEPGSPLFDENLKISVDLDYGLQHLRDFGAWLRVDSLIADMEMGLRGEYSAVQSQRTDEEYRITNEYLMRKWGDELIPSKNPHQLTMRAHRRMVMK